MRLWTKRPAPALCNQLQQAPFALRGGVGFTVCMSVRAITSDVEGARLWQAFRFAPSPTYPALNWSPAIEMRLEHERADRRTGHPLRPLSLVDRHVEDRPPLWPQSFDREQPGNDLDPAGPTVSLASGPRPVDAEQGGELYTADDARTRFQRDWDFLAFHAQCARERYRSYALPLASAEAYQRNELDLFEWRLLCALATYARYFKSRVPGLGASHHPVDTLIRSYHCTGAADVLFALCMVSGLPARRISISHHSMVEALVGGRWVWADNVVGGEVVAHTTFEEVVRRLDDWVHLGPRQKEALGGPVAFDRSPYQWDQALFGHFGSGHLVPAAGARDDVVKGLGLSVGYDPSTARMLYPGQREYEFACPAGPSGGPVITLNPKQAWLHLPVTLHGSAAVRATCTIQIDEANPVCAATAVIQVGRTAQPEQVRVTWNGIVLQHGRRKDAPGFLPTCEFIVPLSGIRNGTNEVIVTAADHHTPVDVLFFPDIRTGYIPCTQQVASHPSTADVGTDPIPDPNR